MECNDIIKQPCVYILTNTQNGTLYTGVTSNLSKRIYEHKSHVIDGFTRKYGLGLLVWYEVHESMVSAIGREKSIKRWSRKWKIELIEKNNSEWNDLYKSIIG